MGVTAKITLMTADSVVIDTITADIEGDALGYLVITRLIMNLKML